MKITFKTKQYSTIATGIDLLDQVLLGGFRKGCVIHFYGDPGAGKTTFAMQIIVNIIKQGWRAIWVDCNGAFSISRFKTLLNDQKNLSSLIYVRPSSFQNQTQILQQLQYHLDRIGIIVVDPITHFYRVERFREGNQGFFHELITKQLSTLTGIAHLQKIPIIVINYGTINKNKRAVPLVEKGFERIERYRFYFKNVQNTDNISHKELIIVRAPETFTQGRVLSYTIGLKGIEGVQLVRKQGVVV